MKIMTKVKFIATSIIIIVATQFTSAQSIDDDIMRYFRVSGTEAAMDQSMEMMFDQFQQMGMPLPPAIRETIRRNMNTAELLREMVPIYRRHFTHNEIRELIRFHESPIGRKMAQVTPAITQESMAVTMRLGERLQAEIMKEMMQQQGR